jgi:hypothetical protein
MIKNRMSQTALAAALALCAASARADGWQATRPVYSGVETLADGVYGLVRGHLFSAILPGRLSQSMSAVPVGSSDQLFAELLEKRQARASRRILEARPAAPTSSPYALAAWRDMAMREETTAVVDALADTLLARYQLQRFGQASGVYALNTSNWDAGFLTSAATLGGAYLYVAGLRTDWTMYSVRVDFDSVAGSSLKNVAESGEGRVAEIRLSRKGSPLSLRSSWGLSDGNLQAQSLGVAYAARF